MSLCRMDIIFNDAHNGYFHETQITWLFDTDQSKTDRASDGRLHHWVVAPPIYVIWSQINS